MVERLVEVLLALGAGGIMVEALRSFTQRRNMSANYADVISTSAIKLLAPLEDRVRDLEESLSGCQKELSITHEELRTAREALERLKQGGKL